MGISTYLANKLLDHQVGKTAYTMPAVYVGLSSTTPTVAGANVTEPSGGAYARVATVGTDWAAAAAHANSNAAAITFPQATADWVAGANLTHFVFYDAATLGNMLAFSALTVAKSVLADDTASFPIGEIDITLN